MTTATHADHGTIINELREQYAPVLENSPDGVYIWVDETNKYCNERLASLFGYSVDEWCAAAPFLESFIDESDRGTYASHYSEVVQGLGRPVTFTFTGIRKDGSRFTAETDMIPIAYAGHRVAYHFVREA